MASNWKTSLGSVQAVRSQRTVVVNRLETAVRFRMQQTVVLLIRIAFCCFRKVTNNMFYSFLLSDHCDWSISSRSTLFHFLNCLLHSQELQFSFWACFPFFSCFLAFQCGHPDLRFSCIWSIVSFLESYSYRICCIPILQPGRRTLS